MRVQGKISRIDRMSYHTSELAALCARMMITQAFAPFTAASAANGTLLHCRCRYLLLFNTSCEGIDRYTYYKCSNNKLMFILRQQVGVLITNRLLEQCANCPPVLISHLMKP